MFRLCNTKELIRSTIPDLDDLSNYVYEDHPDGASYVYFVETGVAFLSPAAVSLPPELLCHLIFNNNRNSLVFLRNIYSLRTQ